MDKLSVKNFLKYGSCFLAAGLLAMSCNKYTADAPVDEEDSYGDMIVVGLGTYGEAGDAEQTKATAVTSLPASLYWSATTGTAGNASSETGKYNDKAASLQSVSSSKIYTGKYQTAVPTAYNWYVSNHSLTSPASGVKGAVSIAATNDTDIVAGYVALTNSSTPAVTLNHIYARTGTLTLNTQSGYNLSNVSWSIKSNAGGTGGTSGTYTVATGAWSGTNGLARTAVGTTKTATSAQYVHTSDMYLNPGSYRVYITYTLTKGDYVETFTGKYADVTLVAGSVNNITATANGGAAEEIVISLSLTPWGTNNITVSELMGDSKPLPGVFTVNSSGKKVKFSPGNLYWNGGDYAFEAHQYDYPTTRNTDHIGHFFYSKDAAIARAASYSDPSRTDTDVLFAANGGAIDGYTVLTSDEWQYLIDHNMQSKATVTIAGINCSVLVPDGYSGSVASSYTAETWKTAEAQGLVAIPYAGYFYNGSFYYAGSYAYCWSCSPYAGDPGSAWYTYFYSGEAGAYGYYRRCGGFSVRLVLVQ